MEEEIYNPYETKVYAENGDVVIMKNLFPNLSHIQHTFNYKDKDIIYKSVLCGWHKMIYN